MALWPNEKLVQGALDKLLEDNQSAIHMCNNTVSHRRTKHIKLRHHYIRELISRRVLTVQYHPSDYNPADLLTKSLGHILFRRHRDVLFGLHKIQGWVQNPLKSIVKSE